MNDLMSKYVNRYFEAALFLAFDNILIISSISFSKNSS